MSFTYDARQKGGFTIVRKQNQFSSSGMFKQSLKSCLKQIWQLKKQINGQILTQIWQIPLFDDFLLFFWTFHYSRIGGGGGGFRTFFGTGTTFLASIIYLKCEYATNRRKVMSIWSCLLCVTRAFATTLRVKTLSQCHTPDTPPFFFVILNYNFFRVSESPPGQVFWNDPRDLHDPRNLHDPDDLHDSGDLHDPRDPRRLATCVIYATSGPVETQVARCFYLWSTKEKFKETVVAQDTVIFII